MQKLLLVIFLALSHSINVQSQLMNFSSRLLDVIPNQLLELVLENVAFQKLGELRLVSRDISETMDSLDFKAQSVLRLYTSTWARRIYVLNAEFPIVHNELSKLPSMGSISELEHKLIPEQFRFVFLSYDLYKKLQISHVNSPLLIKLVVGIENDRDSLSLDDAIQVWCQLQKEYPSSTKISIYYDNSSLFTAVINNRSEQLALKLMEHGIDTVAVSLRGVTPLMAAAQRQFTNVVQKLMENGADLEAVDDAGNTAVFHSINSKEVDTLNVMIESGANLTWRNNNQETLLMRAVSTNAYQASSQLLKAGVDVDAKDQSGRTALMIAVHQSRVNMIEQLIARHAAIDARDNRGATALLILASWHSQRIDIYSTLLNAGALIDAQDSKGATSLMYAAELGSTGVLEELLRWNPDLSLRDIEDEDAFTYLTHQRNTDGVQLLIDHGANVDVRFRDGLTPLFNAARLGYDALIDALIAVNATVDAMDDYGNTPLFYASVLGHENTVERLIASGANVDAKDNNGNTALMYACIFGHLKVVQALVAANAAINIVFRNTSTELIQRVLNKKRPWINAWNPFINFNRRLNRADPGRPLDYAETRSLSSTTTH